MAIRESTSDTCPVEHRVCAHCGKAFTRKVQGGYRPLFQACSAACRSLLAYWAKNGPVVERPCVVCGTSFLPDRRDAKYCSSTCRHRRRTPAEKAIYWQKYQAAHREQLITRCRNRRAEKYVPVQPRACGQCGVEFTPAHRDAQLCSRRCIALARVRQPEQKERWKAAGRAKTARRRANLPLRACDWCRKPFKPKRNSTATTCSLRCHTDRWAAAHPESGRNRKQRRRARLAAVPNERIIDVQVFARDGWRCQLCGTATPKRLIGTRSKRKPTLDHIIPIAKGGSHTHDNVQCACLQCNVRKGAKVKGQIRLALEDVA
jgi:hypothetical protein